LRALRASISSANDMRRLIEAVTVAAVLHNLCINDRLEIPFPREVRACDCNANVINCALCHTDVYGDDIGEDPPTRRDELMQRFIE